MAEKIEIMEALKLMAQGRKNYVGFIQNICKNYDIEPIYTEMEYKEPFIQIFSGLIGSGLELTKTERDCKVYPTKYSIVVDGVKFLQLSEKPWEETK